MRVIITAAIAAEQEDYFKTTNKENRTEIVPSKVGINENAIIRRISLVGIVGNVVLSAFKLFAGIAGNSGAMVSDAVHSLSDVFATFIAFLGVRLSKKAADKEHPYGHERFECVASLLLGVILLITGLGIGKAGLEKIFVGSYGALAIPSMIALVAAIVSIVSKEAMYWYTRHYAKVLNSPAFMVDAWHHRSDAFSSVGSLIGIAGAMLGFPVMDSIVSVVICLFILKVSYDILKDAIVKMMDTSCGEDYEKNLTAYIAAQENVVQVDLLHSRMFGNKIYIELELQVDGNLPLREAHAIAERIHDSVEAHFSDIKHITIHLNPAML
ncbi:cation transporter [Acutalibacter sp. 1XD8-33]|uniref:cation diffusion facilitator family transporter n=1 Tax=Acutalibacter sp. 1XD8-33 TaxID=2320081 RepID=UPI000EA09640|nr:cation diffusion facilitator family transporter [Acutalibacter sp. 1XD8-33]RKJ40899.1 cation transporter [Acutalibacter sp. 1XD8-33]